jgi:segregation and condensation protein B
MELLRVIEALVFASQKPLTPREVLNALRSAAKDSEEPAPIALGKTDEPAILETLDRLRAEHDQSPHPFRLVEKASGWQFVTAGDFAPWVRQLFPESRPTRLSGPALETLAIIAYRQPITRADIEAVRGVAVDGMVQNLLERGLIRIAGRADQPGRPLLYESTQAFLEHFGLRSLEELPNAGELRRLKLPSAEPPPPAAEPAPEGEPPQAPFEEPLPASDSAPEAAPEPAPPDPAP